ncbi:hypothetical protein G3580_15180 [Nitrogeniibacter mangrovi]|uniref:Uncharacterized protein n=1 Tax=Nitrogeniibacter mangrovi TaxID=2016596 RepID=A0A6C1B7Q4_9RHOO|nr:tetratricopeptide repeat protein [Nitrogeniibacter mangrovi]QID18845.1 hypothetical protein G3580_15180 [Nitrogeniibacter mangrovi]
MPMPAPASEATTLLQQALAAIEADDHTSALRLLKAGADEHPDDAQITYWLGAEYACLELFDAAEAALERALAIDPAHHLARFHLGLLMVTRARFEAAVGVWQALDALPDGAPLRHYKQAFDALAQDRFAPARREIDAALAAGGATADLDAQMRRLRDSLPAA